MPYMSRKLNDISDVFCLETSDTTGYAVDWHAHDCHMLLLPRQGSLFLSTESTQSTHVCRQAFSFVPADFAHATVAAPGREEHMTLYVDATYVKRQGLIHGYRTLADQVNRPGIWESTNVLDGILRLHDQLESSISNAAFQRQLPHLKHLIFEECARAIASHPTSQLNEHKSHALLVQDIQRYVRENLETDLNVEFLAHEFHLSRRHLTRIFKTVAHETLSEFTMRARVEKAAHLISTTSFSILEVSLLVGLDSPSYLARLFKRFLGRSPSEMRRPR
ncbi:AraC family transcriptional regulator [Pseudomonas putida]|uniref:AraC family transcriptional regulator n=1 Tax=Pseudomonas putida TaxID=303 RepID=UPI0023635D1C|nr:AraC family transcriptional regulator [Pseudomonas putida]MDD1963863.1 AraC family transcriptional regulator [Pseudomonas putida]